MAEEGYQYREAYRHGESNPNRDLPDVPASSRLPVTPFNKVETPGSGRVRALVSVGRQHSR